MAPTQEVVTYSIYFYLSAGATFLTFLTGILFFTKGKFWGRINDIFSIIQVLIMIPLAIFFFNLSSTGFQLLKGVALILGLAGMLIAAYGQTLLVFNRIDFKTSQNYFPAGAGIGVWLILVNSILAGTAEFPLNLIWTGLLAGAGYLAAVIGFLKGGQENSLFAIGALVLGISYPVWAIWLAQMI